MFLFSCSQNCLHLCTRIVAHTCGLTCGSRFQGCAARTKSSSPCHPCLHLHMSVPHSHLFSRSLHQEQPLRSICRSTNIALLHQKEESDSLAKTNSSTATATATGGLSTGTADRMDNEHHHLPKAMRIQMSQNEDDGGNELFALTENGQMTDGKVYCSRGKKVETDGRDGCVRKLEILGVSLPLFSCIRFEFKRQEPSCGRASCSLWSALCLSSSVLALQRVVCCLML